jgi:hypothetical protein
LLVLVYEVLLRYQSARIQVSAANTNSTRQTILNNF